MKYTPLIIMFNVYRYDHEQRNASPPENRRQTSVPPARRRSRSHSPRRAPAGREKLTINIIVLESNFCKVRKFLFFIKIPNFIIQITAVEVQLVAEPRRDLIQPR